MRVKYRLMTEKWTRLGKHLTAEKGEAIEDACLIIAFVNSKTMEMEWEHKQILRLDEMRRKLMERRLT